MTMTKKRLHKTQPIRVVFGIFSGSTTSMWKILPRGSLILNVTMTFWSKWLLMHTNANDGIIFLANEYQYFLLKIASFWMFRSPQRIVVSILDSIRIWFERNVLKNDCRNIFSEFRIVFNLSFHSICSYYIQYSHIFFEIRYEIATCISNDLPHVDSTANFYCPWQVKAFLLLDIFISILRPLPLEAAPDPKSRFLDLSFWEPLLLCIVEGARASFLSEIFFLGASSLFFVVRDPYVWKLLPTPNQGVLVFPFGSVFYGAGMGVHWMVHGFSLPRIICMRFKNMHHRWRSLFRPLSLRRYVLSTGFCVDLLNQNASKV